ncbi:hypothetical protein ABPG75_011206 [Micractinium tetrahymenae]
MPGPPHPAEDREPLLPTAGAATPSERVDSAAAAEEGLAGLQRGGSAASTADSPAASAGEQPAPPPACRICLQDDEPSSLEKPCSCSGSMAWAHHACIQRWIDEKHDKQCEVCKQQFRGTYRDPPPRPRPAPLVAQLQVDNADNRIVLLADPDSGAIVARVVVPPGGELPEDGFPWVVTAGAAGTAAAAAAATDDDDEDDEEEGGGSGGACSPLLWLLLFACMLGGFAWLASSSEAGSPGADGAQAGAWFVRVMLLTLWIYLRSMRPSAPRRLHHAELERRRRVLAFADLEAGLARRHYQQPVPQ